MNFQINVIFEDASFIRGLHLFHFSFPNAVFIGGRNLKEEVRSLFLLKLIPCFLSFFENFQIRVFDERLDILTNSERKCNISISKSKFGC